MEEGMCSFEKSYHLRSCTDSKQFSTFVWRLLGSIQAKGDGEGGVSFIKAPCHYFSDSHNTDAFPKVEITDQRPPPNQKQKTEPVPSGAHIWLTATNALIFFTEQVKFTWRSNVHKHTHTHTPYVLSRSNTGLQRGRRTAPTPACHPPGASLLSASGWPTIKVELPTSI